MEDCAESGLFRARGAARNMVDYRQALELKQDERQSDNRSSSDGGSLKATIVQTRTDLRTSPPISS